MLAATALLALAGVASAAPFPLSNGFPNPNAEAVLAIQNQAGGTLPNTPLPTELKQDAIVNLRLIAVNELFEVAYFTSLLNNVTNGVSGYTDLPYDKSAIEEALKSIIAQEELHALGANAILKSAGQKAIPPAPQYKFVATDFASAIALANTFTDLVLGTLQEVQKTFALDGGQAAAGLVPLVGSIIGNEAEQVGGFRLIEKKVPSAAPFLTASSGAFAFNAIGQNFLVPGTYDNVLKQIPIPSFKTLTLNAQSPKAEAQNSTLVYDTSFTDVSTSYHVAYISGQNKAVVVPITDVSKSNGKATFKASFPFASGFSKGLTIAAIVKGSGPFASAAAVANATIAGPGLIEV